MKKLPSLFAAFLAGMASLAGTGQGLVLTVSPLLSIPLGAGMPSPLDPDVQLSMAEIYTLGGGAELEAAWSPSGAPALRLGAALAYQSFPNRISDGSDLSSLSLAGSAGLTLEPIPRFGLATAVKGGMYLGMLKGAVAVSPFLQGGARIGFSLSRSLEIGVGLSYIALLAQPQPLYTGLGVSIGAGFTLGEGARRPRLEIRDLRLLPVFPVFFTWYDTNPAGSLALVNEESSTIRRIRVSVFVKEFMDAPKLCAEIPELKRGERLELPLYALYTDRILSVTEATKVALELDVSYELPDGKLEVKRSESIRVLDRNAMTWEDDRRAAAFVTAKDPAVLRFSKSSAGLVREAGGGGNLDFRVALGMFQALGVHGMTYVVDPKSSYQDQVAFKEAVDSLQFPRQTLQYRSGDCDDLAILYAALLESVGIETAFITVPGHIYAAFGLDLTPAELDRDFGATDRFILDRGKVYVPVETTMASRGFLAAWNEGAREWKAAGSAARLWPMGEAWRLYEAAGIRDPDPGVAYPSDRDFLASYGREYDRFVTELLGQKGAGYRASLAKAPGDQRQRNSLAVLLARYGRYEEAEAELRRVLEYGDYLPALVNLGNIAALRKDDSSAVEWYAKALARDPGNQTALAGAATASAALGRADEAKAFLARLESVSPAAAQRIAGVAAGGGSGRAAAAGESSTSWAE